MRKRTPIQEIAQLRRLRRRDGHRLALRQQPHEAALLEPLGVETASLAVPPEHLDQVAALAPEHEQLAGEEGSRP